MAWLSRKQLLYRDQNIGGTASEPFCSGTIRPIYCLWMLHCLHSDNFMVVLEVRGGLVVSVLDCQSRGSGFESRIWQKFGSRFLHTAHCQWEDETVRERTGHPPSYAEAKKMKSLTLHTRGCPKDSLRDCWSSSMMYNHCNWCRKLLVNTGTGCPLNTTEAQAYTVSVNETKS